MVRFGVVGTNWITDAFIKGASVVGDFKLNAVYSRNREKAKEFALKHEVSEGNTFTNLEDMAKSNLIDAVYIASPNSLHSRQSILFLENKKHVICEKPIASNSRELKDMIKASKENNRLLMEAMKTSFLPNFKAIGDNLYKIGKVRRYYASYCQYSSRYDAYKEGKLPNIFNKEFSAGALMDLGVYCIHPLVQLFGNPNSIRANSLLLDSGVDGEGSILLSYDDMDGVIMYSKVCQSYLPSEIQGEKGSIVIDKIGEIENVKIVYKNGETEDITVPQIKENMYYEAKEFIELINRGETESKVNSFKIGLMAMEIMDEARNQTGVKFPADRS